MIDNYEELMELWEWSLELWEWSLEAEMKARIRGVQSYMQQLEFLFGCHLGKMILNHTDNLSKALQDESCTAVEGQDAAMKTVKTLESTRNEHRYKAFMRAAKANQNRFEIDEQSLPGKSVLTITSNFQLITSLKVTSRYFVEFVLKLWIMLFKQSKHVLIKQIGLFTRTSKRCSLNSLKGEPF